MATYSHKRTAHRWRLLAVMLSAVFLASGSFWLLQAMRGDGEGPGIGRSTEPDYIVDNFSFVRMTESGKPRYVISGARLVHNPVGDVSEIEQPVVKSMTTEHPRMTMHANRARVLHKLDQIDLIGKVEVDRPETPVSQAMNIRTDALTVLPDEEIMKTDQPIEMKLGGATLRSVGMQANNATQQVHLSGRSHLTYPPHAKR